MGRVFVFICILSITYPAFTENFQFDISSLRLKSGVSESLNGVCYIPKLTDQQMYIYDEIHRIHFADTKKTRALLSRHKSAYEKVLQNSKMKTKGFADSVAKKYFKTKYILSKDQTAFFHAVYYKILLEPQRKSLLRCI